MHLNEAPVNAPGKQTVLRSFLRRALRSLRQHPFMKLTALLLAIVFWAFLIASDPTILREKVIVTSDITIAGLNTFRGLGYTVLDDLAAMPLTVRMRVKVAQRDYERVTAASFMPRLDLSKLKNVPGEQLLPFTQGLTTYGEVIEYDPPGVMVMVEAYVTKNRVPVVALQEGQSESPLWLSRPVVDPAQVTVSGPSSLINQVARAVVVLPLEALSADRENDSVSASISLQDAVGNPIISPMILITSESVAISAARIDVKVYPVAELPIDAPTAVRGQVAHGFALGEVRLSPETVLVAGPKAVLERMKALYVETPLDMTDASQSMLGGSALRVSSELTYVSASEVVIQAGVDPAVHTHTYTGLPVTVNNLDPKYTAKLSQTVQNVAIRGDYAQIERLKTGQIHLYVDARGLEAGEHEVQVLCRIDGMPAFSYTPQNTELLLTLTER